MKMTAKQKNWLALGLIALALAFLALGVWRGEATVVWRKAAQICLECIGLA